MDIVKEKKRLEIKKVEMRTAEMEFKVLERMEDIERFKKNIEIQNEHIRKLKSEIGDN